MYQGNSAGGIMQLLIASLLLLGTRTCGQFWGPSSDKKVAFASWDEMNVIAHGLLQLGHGLKEHVDKTTIQLKAITGRLNHHNLSLVELFSNARDVRDSGHVLKGRIQDLKDRDRQLHDLTQLLRDKMQEVSKDQEHLDHRLQDIESKLKLLEPSKTETRSGMEDMRSIKSQMEIQNKRINELLEKIQLQQYKLDKQNLQIKNIQSKIPISRIDSQKTRLNLHKNVFTELKKNSSNNNVEKKDLPSDCQRVFLNGEKNSGIYRIKPANAQPFEVFCEMTAEGGWTVVQRRKDGSVDFDQLWEAYENGFGNLNGEFWLGLLKMHQIMEHEQYIMHVELQDWEQNIQHMEVHFHLGGPNTAYALQVHGPVTGQLKNALYEFRDQPFSTRDRDEDLKSHVNCAKLLSGGWWFSTCGQSNLNGKYFSSIPFNRHERKQGIFWKTWRGRYYPLKSSTIKICPLKLATTM